MLLDALRHKNFELQRTGIWRRGRDSNPRDPFEPNGFQDRRFQPLTHPSGRPSLTAKAPAFQSSSKH